jgi:ABC-type amino acid transport substrate-binding protein
MTAKHLTLALLSANILLAGCATPTSNGRPFSGDLSYLSANNTCAIFNGNMGGDFSDPRAQKVWQAVDKQVSDYLLSYLRQNDFKVIRAPASGLPGDQHQEAVLFAVAANKCAKLIQIALQVTEDFGGRKFGFDVDVMRFVAKDSNGSARTNATTTSVFRKEYRFPRTEESLKTFYTGEFADQVFRDLANSGALKDLRSAK